MRVKAKGVKAKAATLTKRRAGADQGMAGASGLPSPYPPGSGLLLRALLGEHACSSDLVALPNPYLA